MVVGVVILVGGLALPFTLQELDRRRETEAIDQLGLLVRLARVESRVGGVPLEVRCDASGRRISVLQVDSRDPPTLGVEGVGLEPTDDPDRRLIQSWSTVELPESLAVVPFSEDEGDATLFPEEFGFQTDSDAATAADPWPDSTRLLLLTPDGAVISTEEFGLRSAKGTRSLRFDPWTALMTIEDPSMADSADAIDVEEDTIEPELDPREGGGADPGTDSVDDMAVSDLPNPGIEE